MVGIDTVFWEEVEPERAAIIAGIHGSVQQGILRHLGVTRRVSMGKKILMLAGDYAEDYETMVSFRALQMGGRSWPPPA